MKKLLVRSAVLVCCAGLASPALAQIGFGRTVAVGDGEVLVGEPGNQAAPGRVYVYRPDSGDWAAARILSAGDAANADGFGSGIAVDGTRLAVGAEDAGRGAAGPGGGAVYVFEKQEGGWVQVARITPDDGADGDMFGAAVGLAGDRLIAGAPQAGGGQGAAYVFELQSGSWRQVARLGGERGDTPERFGAAVAIDGDQAIVGAPAGALDLFLTPYAPSPSSGAAYVFDGADGWAPAGKLADADAGAAAYFGHSVALHDGQALIGAPGANGYMGAVYLYVYNAQVEGWNQLPGLEPYDRLPGTYFGTAVAFDEDEAYVGAPGSGGLSGRVYQFQRSGLLNWDAAVKLSAGRVGQFAVMGYSVAFRGDLVAAGIPGNDYGAGTAVIMERDAVGWSRTSVLSDVSGLDPVTGTGIPCADGMAGPFLCDNVDLVSFLPVNMIGGGRGVGVNDIWGWTDPQTHHDYAVIGMRDGTTFVDVTDPSNPVWVGKLPKTDSANTSLWRDVKVDRNYAFIVSDSAGRHGMQVVDLTKLRAFSGTPLTLTADATYTGINSAHNMVVNPGSDFAFIVGASGGGNTCGGGLHMVNIEDPRHPVFAGCFSDVGTGMAGTGYSHDAQCVTYHGPDQRYDGHEICFGSNETAVSIADVTDKRNPISLARGEYPNVAYTHQGWLTPDQRYFFMDDELDEFSGLVPGTRTLIFDVQELDDPILVGTYQTDNPATDHNLYIVGDVMYQSNYRSGLRVVDISDPESPKALGYFDTVPWGSDAGMGDIISGSIGSWSNYPFFESGIVVVSSGREGMFVLRVRNK